MVAWEAAHHTKLPVRSRLEFLPTAAIQIAAMLVRKSLAVSCWPLQWQEPWPFGLKAEYIHVRGENQHCYLTLLY